MDGRDEAIKELQQELEETKDYTAQYEKENRIQWKFSIFKELIGNEKFTNNNGPFDIKLILADVDTVYESLSK